MQKIKIKVQAQNTETLKNITYQLMNDKRDQADTVMNVVLEELANRMKEEEYLELCEMLCETYDHAYENEVIEKLYECGGRFIKVASLNGYFYGVCNYGEPMMDDPILHDNIEDAVRSIEEEVFLFNQVGTNNEALIMKLTNRS